jgi:hypothetical protein
VVSPRVKQGAIEVPYTMLRAWNVTKLTLILFLSAVIKVD